MGQILASTDRLRPTDFKFLVRLRWRLTRPTIKKRPLPSKDGRGLDVGKSDYMETAGRSIILERLV